MGKQHHAIDLTSGPELGTILRFSAPLFVGNIFQQMYNVVDTIVLGRYVGYEAMASVGLCFPIIFTLLSLFIGIGTGTSVIVAQRQGARNRTAVEETIFTAWRFVLIGCIPVTLLGTTGARTMLTLIGVQPSVLGDAVTYMQIYFLASVATLGYGINDGILRGLGDSRSSLRFLVIACLTNVFLDLIFVLQLRLNVVGVALATVIAQLVAWLLSSAHIYRRYLAHGRTGKASWACMGEICRIGIPLGFKQMLFSFGVIMVQTVINRCDPAFIAGFNAASKIDLFAFMPIQSFASAATTFVGQNVGANKNDRIASGMLATLKLSLLVDVVVVGGVLLLAPQLLSLFNSDPQVIRAGLAYLYRILPFYLIYTIISLIHSVLQGIGDMIIPTIIMTAAQWLGRVPAAWLFYLFVSKDNLFFCYGVGWIVELCCLIIYLRSPYWRKKFGPLVGSFLHSKKTGNPSQV